MSTHEHTALLAYLIERVLALEARVQAIEQPVPIPESVPVSVPVSVKPDVTSSDTNPTADASAAIQGANAPVPRALQCVASVLAHCAGAAYSLGCNLVCLAPSCVGAKLHAA